MCNDQLWLMDINGQWITMDNILGYNKISGLHPREMGFSQRTIGRYLMGCTLW